MQAAPAFSADASWLQLLPDMNPCFSSGLAYSEQGRGGELGGELVRIWSLLLAKIHLSFAPPLFPSSSSLLLSPFPFLYPSSRAPLTGVPSPRISVLRPGGGSVAASWGPPDSSAPSASAVVGVATVLQCVLDADAGLIPGHLAEVATALRAEVRDYGREGREGGREGGRGGGMGHWEGKGNGEALQARSLPSQTAPSPQNISPPPPPSPPCSSPPQASQPSSTRQPNPTPKPSAFLRSGRARALFHHQPYARQVDMGDGGVHKELLLCHSGHERALFHYQPHARQVGSVEGKVEEGDEHSVGLGNLTALRTVTCCHFPLLLLLLTAGSAAPVGGGCGRGARGRAGACGGIRVVFPGGGGGGQGGIPELAGRCGSGRRGGPGGAAGTTVCGGVGDSILASASSSRGGIAAPRKPGGEGASVRPLDSAGKMGAEGDVEGLQVCGVCTPLLPATPVTPATPVIPPPDGPR